MTLTDPVTETDLHGYVDDQLDVARRIEVEAYLSRTPAAAAQVMSYLRARDELRLALASVPPIARPATGDAARRLDGALARRRLLRRLRPAIAAGLLITAGWFAHGQLDVPFQGGVQAAMLPDYVDAAIKAHEASTVRAAMYSQHETPQYDPGELLSATAITMPELPDTWLVKDVQVFPSNFGPSIEMSIDIGDLGELSLFAARPGHFDVVPTTTANVGDIATAYWQIGDVAYALIGDMPLPELDKAAHRLADTLF